MTKGSPIFIEFIEQITHDQNFVHKKEYDKRTRKQDGSNQSEGEAMDEMCKCHFP